MKSLPQPGAGAVLVAIIITCLVLFLFQKTVWLVMPALVSVMFFYCLRPVIKFLVHRGMSHNRAVTWVWVLLQLVSVVVAFNIFRFALAQSDSWSDIFDRCLAAAQNLVTKTVTPLEQMIPALQHAGLNSQLNGQIAQLGADLTAKNLVPVTLIILKWLPCVLLVPYITYFLLKDSVQLKKFIIKSVPNAFFEKSLLLFARLDVSLQNYFQGLLWLTLLDTTCLACGLKVLGIPRALWLGLASAVLAWIPYVGSMIACVMVVLVAAVNFPESVQITYACLVLFIIVRVLDDFIFLPLTIGRKLHVHPLLSLVMLFLGGTVAGGTGLVLALPVFAVVSVISDAASHIVTDRKLIARFWMTRQMANETLQKIVGPWMNTFTIPTTPHGSNGVPHQNGDMLNTDIKIGSDGHARLILAGHLNAQSAPACWDRLTHDLFPVKVTALDVDASGLHICDGAGLALLRYLNMGIMTPSASVSVQGLRPDLAKNFNLFTRQDYENFRPHAPRKCRSLPDEAGNALASVGADLREQLSFIGQVISTLPSTLASRRAMRWPEVLRIFELAGANAVPIISLISFLVGLIIAFETSQPLAQFGAQIYVANMIGLIMVRELGPLLAAVLLAGRSGSAFAAELGTMKVNEELNALQTFGLDPIRFLVIQRITAGVILAPLLAFYATFMGILGGVMVTLGLGFTLSQVMQQMISSVHWSDVVLDASKGLVFGLIVSAVGCLRGLQTQQGPSAVGASTTRAVVSSILLIVIADAVFSVLYYVLMQ